MAYWGGGAAGGWSGGGHWQMVRMRPNTLRRSLDGWDDEELGQLYNHRVMMRLVPYLKPYKLRAALAFVSMAVFAFSSYYQPVIIGNLVDAAHGGRMGDVNRNGIWLLALVIVASITSYLQLTSTGWIGHRILYRLRTQMFDHLQKLSLSFYDNNEVGRVMSRITSDVTTLQDLLTSGLLTIMADFIGLALVIFILMQRDVEVALITFSVVPLLIICMAIWQNYARRAFIRVRQAIAIVNANLQENVSGVRVIQSLSREDENVRRFDAINQGNLSANIEAGRLSAAVMPLVEIMVALATALVIIFGGQKVLNGSMSVGTLVVFALQVQRFFDPVRDLVLQYTQVQRAMAGGERILEVLDTQAEIVDKPDAVDLKDVRGQVDFDHVNYEYIDDVPVLRDFDLHVQPGETIAIVGPTGAGKTTIISLLFRFYDVTGGAVRVDAVDIRDVSRPSLTGAMALVLQDPFLFSGTVRENIRYGRLSATDAEIEEAARLVGAHEFIARLEHGYDTELHERGQNLSGGQRQLISFARAIIADPRILVLDEATASVDTQTEVVIQRALQQLLHGRTSFVIAHRLSTIRNADRVIVLEEGRIKEMGTHDELLQLDGLYARLYRMTYAAGRDGRDGHAAASIPDATADPA